MTKTNIACAQIDCLLGQPGTNLNQIISLIRAAAERDAKLVMFPECALTGYAYESLEEAIQKLSQDLDAIENQLKILEVEGMNQPNP